MFGRSSDLFLFDSAELDATAERYKDGYNSADPFPHVVMEDFLPKPVCKKILKEFPSPDSEIWLDWKKRDTVHQPRKLGIGTADRLKKISPFIQHMLMAFNSSAFVRFLEKLTGIPHLLPDPHYFGGGLHQILPGGKLAIHADFNFLEDLQLYRRLNLLLYLNEDWQDSYGGKLELWSRDMSRCVKQVAPLFNRVVVFNTDLTSYHGHPEPLACPAHRTRKSLALYYYSAQPGVGITEKSTATLWQKRPQETV